jgi:hypothetical protein
MAERTPLLPARAAFPGPRLLWRTGAAFGTRLKLSLALFHIR